MPVPADVWSETAMDLSQQDVCLTLSVFATVQPLLMIMISLFLVYFAEYFINQALVCLTRYFVHLYEIAIYATSVYPAKGRPGRWTTELDSGAQKHLIRSPIKGYGPRPQARARLARAEVGP